ncbi:Uncharacterised protein [Mycobacterium tuberculosis]|uniref:Uncharacterized protein n=1 Tax=Mycobacterium tuberculosis TaxID=1773 RepID=A0A654TUU9_MYCTX|nr:Uncharacterised protein [Mycobacterium tuberculosis]
MCSWALLVEYAIAPRTARSAGVGSSSNSSAWSGWTATTAASKRRDGPSPAPTNTPSGSRRSECTGVRVDTSSS